MWLLHGALGPTCHICDHCHIWVYLGPKSHPTFCYQNAHQRQNIWQSIAIAMWNARGLGPTCLTDPFPVLSGWNHYLFSISYTQRLLINLLSTRPPNTTILDFSIFTAAWSFRGWGRVPRKIKGRCSNPIMHFCSYSPALSLPSFSVISLSTFCRLFFFQTSLKTLPLDSCSLSFSSSFKTSHKTPFSHSPSPLLFSQSLARFSFFFCSFFKPVFCHSLLYFSFLQIWILSLLVFLLFKSESSPWKPFSLLPDFLGLLIFFLPF